MNPVINRNRVFARFEDADYYYRQKSVADCRKAVDEAVSVGDELAEVRAYEDLYLLLSASQDLARRKKFFDDCLLPMTEIIAKPKALGPLYDFLGMQAMELGRDDIQSFFETAIDNGCDGALDREDVLRAMPDLLFHWIARHVEATGRDGDVAKREEQLERIAGGRPDETRFYLKIAELYQQRYPRESDRYVRKCIRLGSQEIVSRAEFCTETYEEDYIKWFEHLCDSGKSIADAARQSVGLLWQTDAACEKFSRSRQVYAERLWAAGLKSEAAREWVRCVEFGLDWADQMICQHAADTCVISAVSETLVERWFSAERENAARENVLGLYLESHPRSTFAALPKGRACVARARLTNGDVMGAVRAIGEADTNWGLQGAMEWRVGAEGRTLVEDVRRKLLEDPGIVVAKDIQGHGYDHISVAGMDDFHFHAEALPDEDRRVLREFVRSGSLDVSAYRAESDMPLCVRYLILERLSKVLSSPTLVGLDVRTRERQKKDFSSLADREFEETIRQKNPMTLVRWIIRHLFAPDGGSERREGEAVLYKMVREARLPSGRVPVLLLAAYWARQNQPQENLLALRLMLQDDRKVSEWISADPEKLFRLAFEEIIAQGR